VPDTFHDFAQIEPQSGSKPTYFGVIIFMRKPNEVLRTRARAAVMEQSDERETGKAYLKKELLSRDS